MKPLVSPKENGDLAEEKPPVKSSNVLLKILSRIRIISFNNWRIYFESIQRQIQERGPVPDSAWQTTQRLETARKIEGILEENCWHEGFTFHPDDPYKVVGEWEIGDLSEFEAKIEIEYQFDIRIEDEQIRQMLEKNITFGEFVDYVIELASPVIRDT